MRMSTRRSRPNVVVADPIEEFRKSEKGQTPEMEAHLPIPTKVFLDHLSHMGTNENQLLVAEFATIPMSPDYQREVAETSYNMEKNRYDNILPYDDTRVKLPMVKWQDSTDYINGSHLDVSWCTCSCNIHMYMFTMYNCTCSVLFHVHVHVLYMYLCTDHINGSHLDLSWCTCSVHVHNVLYL